MRRPVMLVLALAAALGPATLRSQPVDTARLRAAYATVVAVFGGASLGAFHAAAVYDQYPDRFLDRVRGKRG